MYVMCDFGVMETVMRTRVDVSVHVYVICVNASIMCSAAVQCTFTAISLNVERNSYLSFCSKTTTYAFGP